MDEEKYHISGDTSLFPIETLTAEHSAIDDEQIASQDNVRTAPNDFNGWYGSSNLLKQNDMQLSSLLLSFGDKLSSPESLVRNSLSLKQQIKHSFRLWSLQCIVLLERTWLNYWRNPGYNLTRIGQNIFVSIAFASAYVQYDCQDTADALALVTVLLMTSVACSILAMLVSVPVAVSERVVFYREQQSRIYSVFLYTIIQCLVEIPFIAAASLAFVLPFFYIVGMDQFGDTSPIKFFYYWLFSGLTLAFNVFYGQFLVAVMPDHSTAQSKLNFCRHHGYASFQFIQ